MVDKNTINSINDAKEAEYNGRKLATAAEKNIFDHAKLKDASGSPDVNLLRAACVLLENVKKAETKTAKDTSLLNEIKKERDDNTTAFEVVNSHNSQVANAITKLEGFEKPKDNNNPNLIDGKTKEE